jgi:hypothetical protein
MNIELSTKEYRDLLDILHIADLIMTGHRKVEDKRTERHRALIQKLYALAQGGDLDRLVGFIKSVNKYVPTRDFEQSSAAHVIIDEFGDHLFKDELVNRLSLRDAAQKAGGIDRLIAMSDGDRQQLEGPIRQRYIEEFSMNGLANLEVVQGSGIGKGTPVKTSD